MTDTKSGGTLKSQFGAEVAFQKPATIKFEKEEGGKKNSIQSDSKTGFGSSSFRKVRQFSFEIMASG